jgi:hypothetical protein
MSIVRTVHNKENPFVQINKKALWDKELSLEAVGLWARLLSRPDDWIVRVNEISKSCKCGKDRIFRILNELIDKGYAFRRQVKINGRFSCLETYVFEFKMTKDEIKEMFPERDFPVTEPSITEITPPTNIDSTNPSSLRSEVKRRKNKKAPAAPPILLNQETKKFEGITPEDIKRWQDTFPAVNVRKELQECLLWALRTSRTNYRGSIDAWMRNVNTTHTTPFKEEIRPSEVVPEGEVSKNKKQAAVWEKCYVQTQHTAIYAFPDKITFVLPNNETFSVEYSHVNKEFLKLCIPAIKRMNLPF